jgi:hypothetical protein
METVGMSDNLKIPLTAEPIPEKGPLTPAQNMMLCAGCVRCCTYVAVEVDAPDTPWQYDQYVWLLYHKNIWMYVEKGNHWYVQFETVCDKLSPQGHCTVHGKHPVLCKNYDARSCERRGVLSDVIARFKDGDDLVRWIAEHRPKHHQRYMAWFTKEHAPKAYGNAPAQVRDEGAAAGGNLAKGAGGAKRGGAPIPGAGAGGKRAAAKIKPPKMSYYEMPPPPINPLLGVEPMGGVVRKTKPRKTAKA